MLRTERKYRVNLKSFILVFTIVVFLLSALMLVNTYLLEKYTDESVRLSKLHIRYSDAEQDFLLGSNNLTENARLFSETGDIAYLNGYFYEAKEARHREKALESLREILADDNKLHLIDDAMNESVYLMRKEYYSMKLTSIAYDIPESTLPDEVASVELEPGDNALTKDELKYKARDVLFDKAYSDEKDRIVGDARVFLTSMVESSEKDYIAISEKSGFYAKNQIFVIFLALFLVFAMNYFLYAYIVLPLVRARKDIQKGQNINMPEFILEMDALGTAYNAVLKDNMEFIKKLGIQVKTDHLTGMGNRSAYDSYTKYLQNNKKEVIMFVFDVNKMRDVNNTQGHTAGDELLVKVSRCILDVFADRKMQNCFRIGGDEFVAYITDQPENKAYEYMAEFKERQKDYGISVSVGYAYAKNFAEISHRDLFKISDQNMYDDKYKNR